MTTEMYGARSLIIVQRRRPDYHGAPRASKKNAAGAPERRSRVARVIVPSSRWIRLLTSGALRATLAPRSDMRVTCPSCQTKYNIDDKRVPPGGAKLKCARCKTLFPIKAAEPFDGDSSAIARNVGTASGFPLPRTDQEPSGSSAIPLPGVSLNPASGGATPLPDGPLKSSGAIPLPGSLP